MIIGQLSLAIPPWVGLLSTGQCWSRNDRFCVSGGPFNSTAGMLDVNGAIRSAIIVHVVDELCLSCTKRFSSHAVDFDIHESLCIVTGSFELK